MGKYRIITISREFGSGGRVIGEAVANKLGVPFYHKGIIEKVMAETGFAKDTIESVGEYAPGKSRFAYAFIGRGQDGFSVTDSIYAAQAKIIRDIAEKEACVIIGRNADAVLNDREDCFNVFIQGDMPEKIERISRLYDKNESDAVKMIKEMDKKRLVNYRYCTDRKWGARENYDLILNSSAISYDMCVDIIIQAAQGKTD